MLACHASPGSQPAGMPADLDAAVTAVSHAGRVGMVGYCWGGRSTYLAACHANIAAGVAYYGGGIPQLLPDTPRCPVMFHFGERDSHIPLSDVDQVRKANPQGIFHLYPAGHGFNAAALTYGDLVADGIIDPVKVTRSAVVNAASVARMLLTTRIPAAANACPRVSRSRSATRACPE